MRVAFLLLASAVFFVQQAYPKKCTLSASVYMVSSITSVPVRAAENLLTPLSAYRVSLYGSRTDRPLVFTSGLESGIVVPCDQYSYIISSPGLSVSRGYIDLVRTNYTNIIGILSLADIESGMSGAISVVNTTWNDPPVGQSAHITFISLNGGGSFRIIPESQDYTSLHLHNGVYTILVMNGARIVSTEVMYLAPGVTQLTVNGKTGEVSAVKTER